MSANFVWDMPDVSKNNGTTRAIGYGLNDWQLSGIFRGDSGGKYDVGYSYNSGATGQALTGSPDDSARAVIKDVSALGSGCSGNQYAQIDNTLVPATGGASAFSSTAIAGPQVGSRGLESGRNYLTGCKDHRMDIALQRNIRVGGGKMIVFRADIYNVFKAVVINGRQGTLQMNSTTDQTVRNSQFLADGSVDPARLLPNNAGFGAATGAADSFNGSNALRSIQLQIKFVF